MTAQITGGHDGPGSSRDWPALWEGVRERLRKELGTIAFTAWIEPLTLMAHDGGHVRLGVAKPFIRNWVSNHYVGRIGQAFCQEGRAPESLSVTVADASGSPVAVKADTAPVPAPVAVRPPTVAPRMIGRWSNPLRPQYAFDNFVAGPENQFVRDKARAFAEGNGEDVQLLYVRGDPGCGKTHLVNAVALEASKRGKRVLSMRAEDFARHILGAASRREASRLDDELRVADVFVLDDVQRICKSQAVIGQFAHAVRLLASLGRNIVISADCALSSLEGLPAGTKDCLGGGLIVRLARPCRDTCMVILRRHRDEFVRSRGCVTIEDQALERIADIEGASPGGILDSFASLATYTELTKKPVSADMVEKAVRVRSCGVRARPSLEVIQRTCAEFYGLDLREFLSLQRARRVARPRQVAMYLARKFTTRSLPEIGRRFGGKDHTTVLHACRRVEALCNEDPLFKQEVEFLERMCGQLELAAA